jgi:hypothetical protein
LQSFSFTRRPHRRRQIANSGSYHPPNLMLKYDTEIIILPKTIITFFWSKAHVQLCNHAWPFPQPSRDQRRVSPCPFYVCMRDPSTQSCFRDPYCAVIRIRLLFLGRCACFRLNVARIQGSERSAAKSSFCTASGVRKFVIRRQCMLCTRTTGETTQMLPTKKLSPRPSGCDFGV